MRELSLILDSRYLVHDWYQVPVMLTESSVSVTMTRQLALVVSVIPAEAGIQCFSRFRHSEERRIQCLLSRYHSSYFCDQKYQKSRGEVKLTPPRFAHLFCRLSSSFRQCLPPEPPFYYFHLFLILSSPQFLLPFPFVFHFYFLLSALCPLFLLSSLSSAVSSR